MSTSTTTPRSLSITFDFVSSYSYLAMHTIFTHTLFTNSNSNLKITFHPISLPMLFKTIKALPPVPLPGQAPSAKQVYLSRDLRRKAKSLGVPIIEGLPKGFPMLDTRQFLRLIVLLQTDYDHKHSQSQNSSLLPSNRAIQAIFNALWRDGKDFSTAESSNQNMKEIVQELFNNDKEDILAKLNEKRKELDGLLEHNLQKVVEQGGFGLPWFAATNENGIMDTWWGVDQLPQVVGFLGLQWPDVAGEENKEKKIRWML